MGKEESVTLSGTASVRRSIVVAVVIGRASGRGSGGASTDDEVTVGISEGCALDTLRLACNTIHLFICFSLSP